MQKRLNRPVRAKMRLRHKFLLSVLFLLAILAFLLTLLEQKIRPVAQTIATYQCEELCVRTMQDAVAKSLENSPELHRQLYELQRDETGQIISVSCNTLQMNILQNQLEQALNEALDNLAEDVTYIPLGTLSGLQAFSGLGPRIPVHNIPLAHVTSQLNSQFTSAGVNQTKLEVNITFCAEMSAIMAGIRADTTVESEICVAQLLIVGQVPQFYAGGQI